jgi:hypothetical protein
LNYVLEVFVPKVISSPVGLLKPVGSRFGFQNGSSIDSLLDKEDVSLEAILDEDDLLQECKAQNTRLIDYFQRSDVLQRLLGYVTGQIEGEDRGRFKCVAGQYFLAPSNLAFHISQRYPYVATEALCSEIWSIVETCLNNTDQLLVPFWETVLDRTPEDMKTRMTMASQFAKINAVFLSKKPAEVTAAFLRHPVADSKTRCRCSNSSEHSEISSIEYSNTLRCPLFPISSCG